jgi:3',5'-cyclic AMP phosphodiesterase CpdA
MIQLAHFSDIHITARPLGWRREDWFNKRLPGWFNLACLGRGRRFCRAEDVLAILGADLRARPLDHVIFSGDATALGFEPELARAVALLGISEPDLPPGLAVPGNHDYYTPAVVAAGLFERTFARWQHGERVDEAMYPFAQRVGSVWLVGVNSCTANRWTWDAAGSVGAAQLGRLAKLLDGLAPGPRILVTHYPVCRGDGSPEKRTHGLRDLAALVAVAKQGRVCLWLHGHRHEAYDVNDPRIAPFPIICAGSATQTGYWTYGEYTIEGRCFRGRRRLFAPEEGHFRDGETFEWQLPE